MPRRWSYKLIKKEGGVIKCPVISVQLFASNNNDHFLCLFISIFLIVSAELITSNNIISLYFSFIGLENDKMLTIFCNFVSFDLVFYFILI